MVAAEMVMHSISVSTESGGGLGMSVSARGMEAIRGRHEGRDVLALQAHPPAHYLKYLHVLEPTLL